jgi:hypothetical protein
VNIQGSAESAAQVKMMENDFSAQIESVGSSGSFRLSSLFRDQALINLGILPDRMKWTCFHTEKMHNTSVLLRK